MKNDWKFKSFSDRRLNIDANGSLYLKMNRAFFKPPQEQTDSPIETFSWNSGKNQGNIPDMSNKKFVLILHYSVLSMPRR